MSSITSVSPAADPPLPNRTTRIQPATPAVVAKDNAAIGILSAIVAVPAAIAFYFHHVGVAGVLGVIALVLLISLFTKHSDVGQCPFCMAQFRHVGSKANESFVCAECGEYSVIDANMVRPMEGTAYSQEPKFKSAAFKNGSFPNACAACGAPATRLDQVKTSSINKTLAVAGAARLATGAPGLAILSTKHASISVPYCDQHRDAVHIGLDMRKRPVLTWSSLRMMRRYLAVNKGKEKA